MKKVGIVSCYFKDNYGSMLQAYATKRFLDNNDIENETIRVDSNKDFKKGKKKYYLSQVTNYSFIKSKLGMIKLKFDKKINKELAKNITIRANIFTFSLISCRLLYILHLLHLQNFQTHRQIHRKTCQTGLCTHKLE